MLHIDERTLAMLLTAGSVSHFDLHPTDRGFGVFVELHAERGKEPRTGVLMSYRKSPRVWVSIDRFVHYVRQRSQNPPEIRINFTEKKGRSR